MGALLKVTQLLKEVARLYTSSSRLNTPCPIPHRPPSWVDVVSQVVRAYR